MKESLQYRRTDKAIVNAFITLCKKQNFDQITIKDIMDEALVSRNTFYAHYKDKYEIAELLFSTFMETFQENLDAIYKTDRVSIYSLKEEMRAQELQQRYKKFSEETKDIIGILMKIHTDKVDLLGAMKHYFYEKYLDDMYKRRKESHLSDTKSDMDASTEAQIYAAIECATIEIGFSDVNSSIQSDPDHLLQNIINAALFAVGVRNFEVQKKLSKAIMEQRENIMMTYEDE